MSNFLIYNVFYYFNFIALMLAGIEYYILLCFLCVKVNHKTIGYMQLLQLSFVFDKW